jgi:DNA-directed RNA polymerase subunit RPC12/RpoP
MDIQEIAKNKKAGISRPIRCRKCGHKVGYVKIKRRFKVQFIFWLLLISIGAQFAGQIISDLFYKVLFKLD